MLWNKAFWAFFSVTEAVSIMMAAYMSFQYIITGAAIVPLAIWKLAEDVEAHKNKKTPLVKRSILRKLKKRKQL
jgi:hypothetical protein